MERLIFTNAKGQSLTFSNTGTFRWIDVDDLGGLEAVGQTSVAPYQDGVTPEGSAFFESKVVSLEILIASNDRSSALRELNSVLNPKLGIGRLTFEIGEQKREYGKVRTRTLPTLPSGKKRGIGYQMTVVIFEVFDPVFTDADYTTEALVSGDSALEFPFGITDEFIFDYLNKDGAPIRNDGDLETPVIIEVDGPLTSPVVIENTLTGKKIVTQLDIAEGESLTVITEPDNLNVLKTDIATNESAVAFQYIDIAQTEFFTLVQGLNTIQITANEAEVAEARIKYKQRYVGV